MYEKLNFKNGQVLTAEALNHMEEGIANALVGVKDDTFSGTESVPPMGGGAWPDLSTQPSILPYKFMGNYVIEQLIPITLSNIDESYSSTERIFLKEKLMYSRTLILDAALISPTFGYYPLMISHSGDMEHIIVNCNSDTQLWWESHVMEGRPLFVRLVYTTLEEDSSYEY